MRKMIESDMFYKFIDKPVRMTWKTGFILEGKITDVSDDFIVFETTQKATIINKEIIREIVPL